VELVTWPKATVCKTVAYTLRSYVAIAIRSCSVALACNPAQG